MKNVLIEIYAFNEVYVINKKCKMDIAYILDKGNGTLTRINKYQIEKEEQCHFLQNNRAVQILLFSLVSKKTQICNKPMCSLLRLPVKF